MGVIHKLPKHLINRLKAGEIVERPASVVKELLENSLDAGATQIDLEIEKGGKQLIKIIDNGVGIAKEDLPLTIERYATSKISNEKDLGHIMSYGFRGEALATISEVSGFRIQSKQGGAPSTGSGGHLGHELWRDGERFVVKDIPFEGEQGTMVYVTDIFHAIPAREKFLKSDATEWRYIKNLFIDYAIMHRDKQRSLMHNGKHFFSLAPHESLMERVIALTKKDWQPKLKSLEVKDEQLHIYGLVGDASLHFPKGDWVHMFVNGRPVEDRLLKRAIMDAYQRQIVPGTYPFALVFVEIDPGLVDVNVHPRKQQVKFLDPGSMFTRVKTAIQEAIGNKRVNYAAFTKHPIQKSQERRAKSKDAIAGWKEVRTSVDQEIATSSPLHSYSSQGRVDYGVGHQLDLNLVHEPSVTYSGGGGEQAQELVLDQEPVKIIGQLWESYILLQGQEQVYWVDQHALAERIAFEKMKKEVKEKGFQSEVLLQPMTLEFPKTVEIESLLEQVNEIGFDVSLFGGEKIIVHAVPSVFMRYKVDIELVFGFIWGMDVIQEPSPQTPPDPLSPLPKGEGIRGELDSQGGASGSGLFGLLLDEILGMKACKASIKAGQKLSMVEMQQLIQDGIAYIDGMFVCQHGRPSIVGVEKRNIDGLFDR